MKSVATHEKNTQGRVTYGHNRVLSYEHPFAPDEMNPAICSSRLPVARFVRASTGWSGTSSGTTRIGRNTQRIKCALSEDDPEDCCLRCRSHKRVHGQFWLTANRQRLWSCLHARCRLYSIQFHARDILK